MKGGRGGYIDRQQAFKIKKEEKGCAGGGGKYEN